MIVPQAITRRLAALLHRLFVQQAVDLSIRLRGILESRELPDLTAWVQPTADVARPILTGLWQAGAADLARQLAGKRVTAMPRQLVAIPSKSFRGQVQKAIDPAVFTQVNPRVLDAVDAASMLFARSTTDTARDDLVTAIRKLRKLMKRGLERGEAYATLAQKIRRIFADPQRAMMIAVTEGARALASGSVMAAKDSGVCTGTQFLASSDACPNCLPAGNLVVLDKPMAASRVSYNGPILRIHFIRGGNVTVTPNDEFLTPVGLRSATSLVKGDNVIYCALGKRKSAKYPNNDQSPALVENVFGSFAESSSGTGRTVMRVAGEHFHGDGAFGYGEIEIVRPKSIFWNECDICCREHFTEQFFQWALTGQSALPASGHSAAFFKRDGFSPKRSMRRFCHFHSAFGSSTSAVDELNFGQGSFCETVLFEDAMDYDWRDVEFGGNILHGAASCIHGDDLFNINADSCRTKIDETSHHHFMLDSGTGYSNALADLSQSLAGEVSFDKVLRVDRLHYHGPVYDFETESSLYLVGNGVVKSNCLKLNGRRVKFGEAFAMWQKGGPYARIEFPPVHPFACAAPFQSWTISRLIGC